MHSILYATHRYMVLPSARPGDDLSGHQFSVAADALTARGLPQGYLITQIPAGFLIQKYGGKIMLTNNMIGTGVCTALLPAMLQSPKPVLLTWITLTISGEN
eukprot:COSAG06_NODE_39112_length_416_cov_0.817035_1_plen_101_part_10